MLFCMIAKQLLFIILVKVSEKWFGINDKVIIILQRLKSDVYITTFI